MIINLNRLGKAVHLELGNAQGGGYFSIDVFRAGNIDEPVMSISIDIQEDHSDEQIKLVMHITDDDGVPIDGIQSPVVLMELGE